MKTDREMDRMNIVSELRYTDRQSMIDMLLNAAAEHQLPFEIVAHAGGLERRRSRHCPSPWRSRDVLWMR